MIKKHLKFNTILTEFPEQQFIVHQYFTPRETTFSDPQST